MTITVAVTVIVTVTITVIITVRITVKTTVIHYSHIVHLMAVKLSLIIIEVSIL